MIEMQWENVDLNTVKNENQKYPKYPFIFPFSMCIFFFYIQEFPIATISMLQMFIVVQYYKNIVDYDFLKKI